MNKTQRYVTLK